MRRHLLLPIIFTLAVTACTSPGPSTPSSTLTPTTRPPAVLSQPATLYSGPGNISYEKLAELPAGTTIYLTGIYEDFVQATLVQAGNETTGFVWKNTIAGIPGGLPALDRLQVPWEPMYLPQCAPGEYDPQADSVTLTSREGEYYFDTESAAWSLETPVRIRIEKLTVTGNSYGSVKVLGSPEGAVSQDVWWEGVTAMSIESLDGNYVLVVLDGTSENQASIDLNRSASQPIQILFDQPEGKSFAVLDENNQELQHVDLTTWPGVSLPNGLFPERKFYFGTDTAAHSSLVVTGLTVGTEPDGKWVEPADTGPGLVSLAEERGLTIGTDFVLARMIDRRYCQAMQRDFDLAIVGEFSATPPFWLAPGQYDFGRVDRIVEFAQQRGWRVFASHLVWGDYGSIPDWLRNGTFTRDEYISILEQHIETIAGRYRGRVQEWSIANEASERIYDTTLDPTTSNADFWYDKIGPEYIEMAFRWASEADPDGILIFNTSIHPPFDSHSQPILDLMYATVQDFKTRGVPIDGVGLQMHLLMPRDTQVPPQKEPIIETMRKFADLGVRIYITELEVDIGSRSGAQDERYAYQAQIYRDVLDACLESGVCDGFYIWGISDALSWVLCPFPFPKCLDEPNGDPLLFDRDFNPKPAYGTVRDALAGIPAVPTPTGNAPGAETPVEEAAEAAPTASPEAVLNMYDDFDNPVHDGVFDAAKWSLAGSSPAPEVYQQDGSLTIVDASDEPSGDVTLAARAYDGITLDAPIFIESNLALAADSAPGTVSIKITASDPAIGTWLAGCGIERYSSQFRGNCTDFVWPQQEGHSFETPKQSFEPGSWHTLRIELVPETMTITYIIDGVMVGSHVLADAGSLGNARFQFSLSTWKTSANSPVTGLISYVSIGQIGG